MVEGMPPSEVSNTDSALLILVMLVDRSSTQYNSQQNIISHSVSMKYRISFWRLTNEAISINTESKLHKTEQQQVITAMQKKAKIKPGQDHNTLRILVVFIFSFKVLLDLRYKRHPM
jgi:hypothetical protein